MRFVLGAFALMLMAAPASAQQTTAPASPAALGLELINQAHADGVFAPVPAERIVALRHLQSGMICRFDPGVTNRLTIFEEAPRGDDVACETGDGDETVALYATRYPAPTTSGQQLGLAGAALVQRFPTARAIRSPARADPALVRTMPPHNTRRYALTLPDGRAAYARVSVAVIGPWTIKLRYTAAAATPAEMQTREQTAFAIWRATLADFMRSQGARGP